MARTLVVDSGCWEWQSTKKDGYGYVVIDWNQKHQPIRRPAHRVLYELIKTKVPKELDLDHLCRNRACVNPDHLEPVTRKENVQRGILSEYMKDKNRNRKFCGKNFSGPHEWIEENIIKNGTAQTCKLCRAESKRRSYWRDKNDK